MELLLFPFYVYVLPKARLFSRADGRTDGENPAPPDQRAAASNPGALQGRGIRGDHLAGKMQKFRRQHGVVDLRDRLHCAEVGEPLPRCQTAAPAAAPLPGQIPAARAFTGRVTSLIYASAPSWSRQNSAVWFASPRTSASRAQAKECCPTE